MTLYMLSSYMVSPQNEFLNVLATQMNGQWLRTLGAAVRFLPRMNSSMCLQPRWLNLWLCTLGEAMKVLSSANSHMSS